MSFKEKLMKFTNEYADVYNQVNFTQNYKHDLGNFIRHDIVDDIKTVVDNNIHLVKGSCGAGRWTTVPWIAVFDKRVTTSAQKGVYIVYLLNKDNKELYLTLNQGATTVAQDGSEESNLKFTGVAGNGSGKLLQSLSERAAKIRKALNIDEIDSINTGSPGYDAGCIFYKKYTINSMPDDETLFADLNEFISLYGEYYSTCFLKKDDWWPSLDEYTPGITKETWLEILQETDVLGDNIRRMLAAMYEMGGSASCAELANKYGNTPSHYIMSAVHAAERTSNHTGCPVYEGEENAKWWPILFVGKSAGTDEPGRYIWKIRDELAEALNEVNIATYLPKTNENKIGKFDSWEIVDESTAIKTCDKSFFDYNGSGVPQKICWFFDAEEIEPGENKPIQLIFDGNKYSGKLTNDTTDRRRIQIRWNSDLGKNFDEYKDANIKVKFTKISDSVYEIIIMGGEKEMTAKEQINAIESYIAAKGFNYDGNLVENFYLSLKSKPFVILAGTSGTGKTRLVRLFAEAINAEYKLVSVRPDWSDSSDLFGHVDLNQKFVEGDIIEFVKSAEFKPNKPFILCLDEMNLARVEYYMSDILSTIETRRFENDKITTDAVVPDSIYGNDRAAAGKYGKVILPGNLYIVGTVNMDETTFPFSKKVLDRANTIEFSYVDLLALPFFEKKTAISQSLANDFLAAEYITLNDCNSADKDYIENVCTKLQRINNILETANAHIGYRVRDEIVFYMVNNRKTELLDENTAFDNQIMQKILPRIQGSSESIKTMLEELLKICESEKYEASTKKINFMIKRYEEDGFTSYWL